METLTLLQRYGGELIYRVRPPKPSVIATRVGYPYEIHVVTFPARSDFHSYRDDPERIQHLPLKDASVSRVILIEGEVLA